MPTIYRRNTNKRCNACGETKPLGEFYYAKNQMTYSHHCKLCMRAHRREQRIKCHKRVHLTRNEEETRQVLEEGWHVCRGCGARKSVNEFRCRWIKGRPRLNNFCNSCRYLHTDKLKGDPWTKFLYAVRSRSRTFGITVRDYLVLLQAQEFRCAICQQPLSLTDQALDHDHTTGASRGILHNNCNVLLGCARDDAETLLNAALYLERGKTISVA